MTELAVHPVDLQAFRLGGPSDREATARAIDDDAPGLQVNRDGAWQPVSVARGTFVGNIGARELVDQG